MIRKPAFSKSKPKFTMASIPEEEKLNSSMTSCSSLDKDDFEKVEKPFEIETFPPVLVE
jgi:hypothetical protein